MIRFIKLLLHYYGSNQLKLNDKPSGIMIMKKKFKKEISFQAENKDKVWNVAQIKVLGVMINPQNNMTTNIARSRGLGNDKNTTIETNPESDDRHETEKTVHPVDGDFDLKILF